MPNHLLLRLEVWNSSTGKHFVQDCGTSEAPHQPTVPKNSTSKEQALGLKICQRLLSTDSSVAWSQSFGSRITMMPNSMRYQWTLYLCEQNTLELCSAEALTGSRSKQELKVLRSPSSLIRERLFGWWLAGGWSSSWKEGCWDCEVHCGVTPSC